MLGAFPQPFLSGYDGKRRSAVVVSSDPSRSRRGDAASRPHRPPGAGGCERARAGRQCDDDRAARLLVRPAGAAVISFHGDPRLLLRKWPFRYRYQAAQ